MSDTAPKSRWRVDGPLLGSVPLWPAFGFQRRLRGRGTAPPDAAVLLASRSVHGFFLRRAVPVVVLTDEGAVRAVEELAPRRILTWQARRYVLELPPDSTPPPRGASLRLRRMVR